MANEVVVTIGSLTLNDPTTLSSGVGYFLEETSHLLNTLQTRLTTTEKQSAHGVNDSLSFYKERPLPFKGTIIGTSQADRKVKEDALKRVLGLPAQQNYATNDGYILVLITDEDGSLKQCYAKILDPPTFDILDDADPTMRAFSFQMMAKDKNLYSQTLQSASGTETVIGTSFAVIQGNSPRVPFSLYQSTYPSVIVSANGTTGSLPIITITGPTQSPKVMNLTTGRTMSFPGLVLLAGETLTIDTTGPSIIKTSSGVQTDVSGYLDTANSQWVIIEGGSNQIALIDASPDIIIATIQVQWRDAYL